MFAPHLGRSIPSGALTSSEPTAGHKAGKLRCNGGSQGPAPERPRKSAIMINALWEVLADWRGLRQLFVINDLRLTAGENRPTGNQGLASRGENRPAQDQGRSPRVRGSPEDLEALRFSQDVVTPTGHCVRLSFQYLAREYIQDRGVIRSKGYRTTSNFVTGAPRPRTPSEQQ